jgi:hypothetical protein
MAVRRAKKYSPHVESMEDRVALNGAFRFPVDVDFGGEAYRVTQLPNGRFIAHYVRDETGSEAEPGRPELFCVHVDTPGGTLEYLARESAGQQIVAVPIGPGECPEGVEVIEIDFPLPSGP